MKPTLKETMKAIKGDLPLQHVSLFSFFKNYLYNSGFRVLLNHRIGKYCFYSNFFLIRQLGHYYKLRLLTKRSCDISYKAQIGSNVKFPHPIGKVIGEGVSINNNVKIWQGVTIGSHGKKNKKLSYPSIMDGVKIYAGAKIIGGINLGENSVIGANALVNINVPKGKVAVGIPCKVI